MDKFSHQEITKKKIEVRLKVCLAVLDNTFSIKSLFGEKLNVWKNLESIFKKLKNHYQCFLERHLISYFHKKVSRENTSTKSTLKTLSNTLLFFQGSITMRCLRKHGIP